MFENFEKMFAKKDKDPAAAHIERHGDFSENIEQFGERPQERDGRLANDEALLVQTYATEKEGIEFSERAGEDAYADAERILAEMKDNGVNLENLDWKVIAAEGDFEKFVSILKASLETSAIDTGFLDTEIEKARLRGESDNSVDDSRRSFLRNALGVLAVAFIASATPRMAEAKNYISDDRPRTPDETSYLELLRDRYFDKEIGDWLSKRPKLTAVVDAVNIESIKFTKFSDREGGRLEAVLHVSTKKHKTFTVRGRSFHKPPFREGLLGGVHRTFAGGFGTKESKSIRRDELAACIKALTVFEYNAEKMDVETLPTDSELTFPTWWTDKTLD